MSRMWITLLILTLLNVSCTKDGVQGTNEYSSFQGAQSVEALSPTAVRIVWALDSRYSSYNIYQNNSVTPVKSETFSTSIVNSLTAGTTYTYRVTGVQADKAESDLGATLSVTTMNSFLGLTLNGVTLKSPTEVNLTWNSVGSSVSYKIFSKKKTETWNLNLPSANVNSTNQYSINNLTPGEYYCFYIQANYADKTFEPTATTESAVNAVAPCIQMTSQLANVPTVSVSSVVPGSFPWFWTSGGANTYKTEIFELDTDIRIASRTGNGTFRAFAKALEGQKLYYALVSSGSQVTRVPVNIEGHSNKTITKIRNVSSSGDHGPLFPPLINGGNGKQNLGSQVVTGDFNCDGLPDLAVSMPTAVIVPSTNHYVDTGAVVVYYSHRLAGPCFDDNGDPVICPVELKTDVAPSASASFPNPTLITYPATSNLMRFGQHLATGNFNGDCYERDSGNLRGGNCNSLFASETDGAKLKSIKSCDDLVVGLNDGSFNVIYGDPSQGLISGSGGSSAGQNEFTCDEFSNSCRVVKMTTPSGYTLSPSGFGQAFTTGDFNNDGYDELAVTAKSNTVNTNNVLIYRGGPRGLYPISNSSSHASIEVANPAVATGISNFGAITTTDDFGFALGTAFNSRKCVNGTPGGAIYKATTPAVRKGYDFSKCDDVVIGAPGRSSNRGSIFSCKGNQADSVDKQRITSWTCQEHFPTELASQASRYGASVLGVPNLNGYPVFNIVSNPTNVSLETPDIAGAVFVGAPSADVISGGNTYSRAGSVFGYYVTPLSTDYFSGGIQGILGSSSSGHVIEATNAVACDKLNANKATGSLRHCYNQKITMSPPSSNVGFGTTIGVIPKNSGPSLAEQSMKMIAISAPYRSILKSDGATTVSGAGSIYLYNADVSNFGYEGSTPILSPKRSVGMELNYSCTTNCTWYSAGLSPFGPSIFYPSDLTTNANFGAGGIVGGSFNDDEEGDLVASAPNLNLPTPQNGAAYIFESNGGFAPSENRPSQTLNPSIGLEGGYKFEESKNLGDINGDGYEDLATHINANGTWSLVIYYGSANGLVKAPSPSTIPNGSQPLLLKLASDTGFGKYFAPVGDVNGDGYADLLVIGNSASYIYYGSSAGLVAMQDPVVSPIGKSPLKFASSSGQALTINASTLNPTDPSYNSLISVTTFGDYNQDGFGDFAIRVHDNFSLGNTPTGSMNFQSNQTGRVFVFYGSSSGPQVNRLTGRITLLDSSNDPVDIAVVDPCSTGTPAVCKIQVLGSDLTSASVLYGASMTTLKHKSGPTFPLYDRLVVSDLMVNVNGGTYDGTVNLIEGSPTGLKASVFQKLVPPATTLNDYFGYQVLNAGDINGDQYEDLIVASGRKSNPYVTVFYGQNIGGSVGFYGASSVSAVDYWSAPAIVKNAQIVNPAQPRPQLLQPANLENADLFGWGLTALGDFNNDGFADVAINVPNADSNLNGLVSGTGYVVVFYGSTTGLRVADLIVSPYPRCYGGASPACDPFQIFLPNSVEYENTSINPQSAGDFNGDGYKDLAIGGVGRDLTVSGQKSATSTGVIYILY